MAAASSIVGNWDIVLNWPSQPRFGTGLVFKADGTWLNFNIPGGRWYQVQGTAVWTLYKSDVGLLVFTCNVTQDTTAGVMGKLFETVPALSKTGTFSMRRRKGAWNEADAEFTEDAAPSGIDALLGLEQK